MKLIQDVLDWGKLVVDELRTDSEHGKWDKLDRLEHSLDALRIELSQETEYLILFSWNCMELQLDVSKHLQLGYMLVGGLGISPKDGTYYQAVARSRP